MYQYGRTTGGGWIVYYLGRRGRIGSTNYVSIMGI